MSIDIENQNAEAVSGIATANTLAADPLGDDAQEQPVTIPSVEPKLDALDAAVGGLHLGKEVTVPGQVRLSLARDDRNVSLRIYGGLNDLLRALGPLRVMPGPYEDGRIVLRFASGRGRAVEIRDRADYCKVEYKADPAVIELLRERHSHGHPLLADAAITIQIPTITPTVKNADEVWITDGEGRFCLARFAGGDDELLARASADLDGTWRHVGPEDDAELVQAKASGDYLERAF